MLQHPLPRPPPADIMTRLQSLTPIRPIICRLQTAAVQVSVTDTYDESEFLREFGQVSFSENLISYDASEFLREFNHLQSSNVDILARALELSSIPSNNDLLSQAMEINEINADTIMDF